MNTSDYVVVTIMSAVWFLLQIFKKPVFEKYKLNDYIPLFAGLLGILFSIWINKDFTFPLFLEGLASGFSATGLNEGINSIFFKEGD